MGALGGVWEEIFRGASKVSVEACSFGAGPFDAMMRVRGGRMRLSGAGGVEGKIRFEPIRDYFACAFQALATSSTGK